MYITLNGTVAKRTFVIVRNSCSLNCRDPDCLRIGAHGLSAVADYFSRLSGQEKQKQELAGEGP